METSSHHQQQQQRTRSSQAFLETRGRFVIVEESPMAWADWEAVPKAAPGLLVPGRESNRDTVTNREVVGRERKGTGGSDGTSGVSNGGVGHTTAKRRTKSLAQSQLLNLTNSSRASAVHDDTMITGASVEGVGAGAAPHEASGASLRAGAADRMRANLTALVRALGIAQADAESVLTEIPSVLAEATAAGADKSARDAAKEIGGGGGGGGRGQRGSDSPTYVPDAATLPAAISTSAIPASTTNELERLRAEVEATNAAKRKLTLELKAAKVEAEENTKRITVLKAQLSRFVKNAINPEATAEEGLEKT